LLLAGVFATAGVAKLLDRQGSRQALAGFGVPERGLVVAVVLLPLAELATAVALIPRPSAQWAGVAALLLLLGFIGGIGNALARGRAPDCHCFGQLHSEPAGQGTLIRNAALAVAAAVVAFEGPGPSLGEWIGARTGTELVAVGSGAAAVSLGAFAFRLWQQNRGLRRALDETRAELGALPPGLPVGAVAPGFSLPSVRGETITLEALRGRGRPIALVFVAPGCGPCEKLFSDLGRWQATVADHLTVAIISTGGRAENLAAAQSSGADVLLQRNSEVMRAYRVGGTPATVVVSAEGRVACAPASGSITSESLIRLTLRRHGMSAAPNSPAPPQPVA
jgi:thiol-disulfide isomerase/thioredoxin